jgi:hypothetical protein
LEKTLPEELGTEVNIEQLESFDVTNAKNKVKSTLKYIYETFKGIEATPK